MRLRRCQRKLLRSDCRNERDDVIAKTNKRGESSREVCSPGRALLAGRGTLRLPTTATAPPRNFGFFVQLGDIVSVNGKPAKGTTVVRGQTMSLSPTPAPGQALADITRVAASEYFSFSRRSPAPRRRSLAR
jgi:hypothetical protein